MQNDNMEWENLGNGIIEQAHNDYLDALLLEHKAILALNKAARLKSDVLKFYGNDWYYSLTNVDPGTLIDTARKQADYIIWQRNNHCEVCKIDSCPHKEPKKNWKVWADGRKTCIKVESNNKRRKKSDVFIGQTKRLMDSLGITKEEAENIIHIVRNDPSGPRETKTV